MKRELPIHNIAGTDFEVDAMNLRLREKANPGNILYVSDMRDVGNGYEFDYSPREKNIPMLFTDDLSIRTVMIPDLVRLDPIGMAEKYKHPLDTISGKSDFDLMVDQQALSQRLAGYLPTIDVYGHTFFVDIRMDMLRPKDDFLSSGISFTEIQHYYNDVREAYVIPYNYQKREFQELDHTMTTIPENLMIVSFPHESKLDPIGFNRNEGFNERNGLKEVNVKSHFEAKVLGWKESCFVEQIRENIREQKKQQQSCENNDFRHKRRRGRKM
jgi:hypothetical protein